MTDLETFSESIPMHIQLAHWASSSTKQGTVIPTALGAMH